MFDEVLSGPPRFPVTAEFLAEARRKQAAYEESRRRHRAGFQRRSEDEADELDDAEVAAPITIPSSPQRRRSRRKINDPRQLKLEL